MKPVLLPCLLLSLGIAATSFGQGSLTPPSGPTPTMKSLNQIRSTGIPLSPETIANDANNHFIITTPGSYFLTANLAVTKTNGIQVSAEGVNIDLNGFQISRASGSGGDGIQIALNSNRTSVRNGSIKGFANGVECVASGVAAKGCAFRDLAVSGCSNGGILAGNGAVLESCLAHDNSGLAGISAKNGSTLSNCTASNNTTDYGILAEQGSTLNNCTATSNTSIFGIYALDGSALNNCSASFNSSTAATSAGIAVLKDSTINHCSSHATLSTASTLTPTTGMGFFLNITGNTIQGSSAGENFGDGIYVSAHNVARENACNGNGQTGGDGAGIHANGSDNRLENNNLTNNRRGFVVSADNNRIDNNSVVDSSNEGFKVTGMNNLVIRNNAISNGANYSGIVAGNIVGPIVGNTNPIASTSPWANFSW